MNVSQLVQDVIDGAEDPLKAYANLKEYQKFVSTALSEIEGVAMEEAEKFEKTFEYNGFRFTRVDGRKLYNFKTMPSWVSKQKELKEIEEKGRAALTAMEKDLLSVTQDGEMAELPTFTITKSSLSVKAL